MTSKPSAKKLLREHSGAAAKLHDAMTILSQIETNRTAATDRALAIQGTTMVQDTLKKLIRKRLRKDFDEDESKRLFGFPENGPLASFGACALMGYALNIYGPVTLKDLRILSEIRNSFAHAAKPLDFEFEPLGTLCQSIQICGQVRPVMTARELFKSAIAELMVELLMGGRMTFLGGKPTFIPLA